MFASARALYLLFSVSSLVEVQVSSLVLPDAAPTDPSFSPSVTLDVADITLYNNDVTETPLSKHNVNRTDNSLIKDDTDFVFTSEEPVTEILTTVKTRNRSKNKQKNRQKFKNVKNKIKEVTTSTVTLTIFESENETTIEDKITIRSTTPIIISTTVIPIENFTSIDTNNFQISANTSDIPIYISPPTENEVHAGHYIITFVIITLIIALIAYISYYLYQRYQTRQLRLQLMPIYNYDPQETEDWENQLLEEEQTTLRQPKEKIQLYSVLID